MNKVELIKEIKRIQKEEQDYQALFKLMLKKSGKDIRSMGDDDKKKFFNAVDKAYKAKTEGKLKNTKSLQENFIVDIISSPLGVIIAIKFALYLLYYFYDSLKNKSKYKEQDYVVKYTIDKIKNDKNTKNAYLDIVSKNINDSGESLAKKIVQLPIIKSHIKFSYDEYNKNSKSDSEISIEDITKFLQNGMAQLFNDKSTKRDIINKLKNDIK